MKKQIVLISALALMLTACGGSASDELTALEVTQILEEANIPCEDQEIEAEKGELFVQTPAEDAGFTRSPDATVLTCYVTGGAYMLVLFDESEEADDWDKVTCFQYIYGDAYDAAYQESAPAVETDLAFGSNWFAQANDGALVTADDLADALGGQAQPASQFCEQFEDSDAWREQGTTDGLSDLKSDEEQDKAERERAEAAEIAEEEARRSAFFEYYDPTAAQETADLAASPDLTPSEVGSLFQVFKNDLRSGDELQTNLFCILSRNPATPPEVMDQILDVAVENDEPIDEPGQQWSAPLARCVASSDQTSTATLEELAAVPNAGVSASAQKTLRSRL